MLSVIIILIAGSQLVAGRNCSRPPHWTAEGRDIMEETYGEITLVFKLKFDCPGGNPCRNLLSGLQAFKESIDNYPRIQGKTNYIIVPPPSDRAGSVNYWKRYLERKGITVLQDDQQGRIWSVLGGDDYDIFLYDKFVLNGVVAWLLTYRIHRVTSTNTTIPSPQSITSTLENHVADRAEENSRGPIPGNFLKMKHMTTKRPTIRVFFAKFKATVHKKTDSNEKSIEVVPGGGSQSSTEATEVTGDGPDSSTKKPTTVVVLPGQTGSGSTDTPSTTDGSGEIINQVTKKPVEGAIPDTTTQAVTTTTKYAFSIPGVDCSGFSDRKCRLAQEAGEEELHPCCYKGVYITDMCRPPQCSEDTYQVCCFQRFMQARYRCCRNESVTCSRPDDFSRCCYNAFTEDVDSCCPAHVAKGHWGDVMSMCMPHVNYEWAKAKVPFKQDEENRALDLSERNGLDFHCDYTTRFPKCKAYKYAPRSQNEE